MRDKDHPGIRKEALDYLYSRSRGNFPRAQWEAAVRQAHASYLTLREARRSLAWEKIIDPDAAEQVASKLREHIGSSQGMLFLTFHGGFAPAAVEMFRRRYNGVTLGGGEARKNARDATFWALSTLRDGGRVLMSPDGFQGRQSAEFHVLGATMAGGGGAAFLAYTCRCSTAWYTAVKQSDRFAPVFEIGPTAREGESLKAFSDRLYSFYTKKIEENFTGNPNYIVLLERWAKRFAAAAERASQISA